MLLSYPQFIKRPHANPLFTEFHPDAAQLGAINDLYAAILDDSPLYLAVVDRRGIIVSINQMYAGLLGRRADALLGLKIEKILPFSRISEVLANSRPVVAFEASCVGKKLLLPGNARQRRRRQPFRCGKQGRSL